MKSNFTVLFIIIFTHLILLSSCTRHSDNFIADDIFSEQEQVQLIESIIRFSGHLPPKANHQSKFDPQFDDHYLNLVQRHKLEFIHLAEDGTIYFLKTRPAASLYNKRVAIAGRVQFKSLVYDLESILFYEEIFRTWKMKEEELLKKSALLFNMMIRQDDLTPYYSENSGDEEYIEFPNRYTHFDNEQRIWVTSLEIPIAGTRFH